MKEGTKLGVIVVMITFLVLIVLTASNNLLV